MEQLKHLLKYHLHVLIYSYFWLGLFICGLLAPQHRIDLLESTFITQGWHLSALGLVLILPIPLIYCYRIWVKQDSTN